MFHPAMNVPARLGEAQWFVAMITHNFLHVSPFHLLGNMYFLWILGDNLEDVLGPWKYLVFYLTAALASGLADTFTTMQPDVPRLGASGAVSGVIAAYAVLFRHAKLTFMVAIFQFKLDAPIYISIWAGFNVIGLLFHLPEVAWEGHLGGFVFGLVVAAIAYRPLLRRDPLLRLLNGVRLHELQGGTPWSNARE
jgi:membrane associated rhomboid family serine protease